MTNKSFYVFSYGSNLLLNRILHRTKSALVVDTHELNGFKIVFNKKSTDGSIKANIEKTDDPNDSVWGAIHKLNIKDKPILDQYENLGNGYDYYTFPLSINTQVKTIHAYMATDEQHLENGLPYDWYLNFVIDGSIQNNFPKTYIQKLKAIESKRDGNHNRSEKNKAILYSK